MRAIAMPLGFGLNNPALAGLISRATPQDEQGAYLGLNQSISSFARMSGPPLAGFTFHALGPHAPFLFAGGVLVLATLGAYAYHRRFGGTFARAGAAASAPAS